MLIVQLVIYFITPDNPSLRSGCGKVVWLYRLFLADLPVPLAAAKSNYGKLHRALWDAIGAESV